MFQVGDHVRSWSWLNWWGGDPFDGWFFASKAGLYVRSIHLITCECEAQFFADYPCKCSFRVPLYYVRLRLPDPHGVRSNDLHMRLHEVPRRPWQMRRGGRALELIGRRVVAAEPQMDLFA